MGKKPHAAAARIMMTSITSGVYWMKIDMSPDAISRRLSLSLANSSAGKEIQKKFHQNKSVKRTTLSIGKKAKQS